MLKIATKTNANGNRQQITIDNDRKTVACGFFLFPGGADVTATPGQLKSIINALAKDGYKIIK